MTLEKTENGNNKRWILKKKFTFAAVVLLVITIFAFRGFVISTTVADFAMLMTAYATASGAVLALIFAADVTDKKLNGGQYNSYQENEPYYQEYYKEKNRENKRISNQKYYAAVSFRRDMGETAEYGNGKIRNR